MNPARLLEYEGDPAPEPAMDELQQLPGQVLKLASDVEHIQRDVADIKVQLLGMDDRMRAMDERLCAKVEGGGLRSIDRIEALRGNIEALQKELSSAKIWAFGLYVAQGAALLFVMAKGFKWF
jgi:hypothetical protein